VSTGGTKFALEDFHSVRGEVDELFYKHWEEIALNKDKIRLNPDWSYYEALHDANQLGVYTARKEGTLIGYFVVVATPHPHYKDHTFARNDILFIDPDHRKGLLGYRFLKWVVAELTGVGISVVLINTKNHKDFGALLERMKFTKAEQVYTKYVRGD
jgi:GNAT superfamily N-acetyltransferase